MSNDVLLFSEENILKQIETTDYTLGFYKIQFYSINGLPSAEKTDTITDFYVYPSGGTLRDKNFNIVFYSTRFDIYKGFTPPYLRKP